MSMFACQTCLKLCLNSTNHGLFSQLMHFDRCFCLQVRNGLLAKLVKLSRSMQNYFADFN